MNATKHKGELKNNTPTPGPWATSRDAVPAGHVQITVYAESDGERVATAFRTEGNANLIAAAPEMLEAAELMWAFYQDLANSNPGFMGKLCLQDYAQWNQALMKLPAAISKAKGNA